MLWWFLEVTKKTISGTGVVLCPAFFTCCRYCRAVVRWGGGRSLGVASRPDDVLPVQLVRIRRRPVWRPLLGETLMCRLVPPPRSLVLELLVSPSQF